MALTLGDPNEAGGQRLRWWQEEKPITPPVGGVGVRVQPTLEEIAAVLPDMGLELEEEAMRRSTARARGERVEVYADLKLNNARLRRRLSLIILPIILLCVIAPVVLHLPFLFWFSLIYALEYIILYRVMSKRNAKLTRPVVTLTLEGIVIHSAAYDLGLVRWDEIAGIRAFTSIYRYVGIDLADADTLVKRLPRKNTEMLRLEILTNRWRLPWLRKTSAPISLAQELLPITADDLVKKIETFRHDNNV